ncbi:MAG: pyridoxal phosphate-dependent aminotransferase [Oscillochloridaceae bacterium umkhey_bin13]
MDGLEPVAHGALDYAELTALGLCPEGLIDFSSNLNPFGPPPGVRAALAALDPAPYPDRSCHALRLALAERHGCTPAVLLPGNGANDLIHLIARALLSPGDPVLVLGPTYGEYTHASRLACAQVLEVHAGEAVRFQLEVEALEVMLARTRPRLTWLCTPNNPTGVAAAPQVIQTLAGACAAHGGYLILDRSYHDMQRPGGVPQLEAQLPNLIQLHSLTKSYALAGLRLGYLLAVPELVARLGVYQPTWSVNSAAQVAGLAALADHAFLPGTMPQLWAASDTLEADLLRLGFTVWRAALPFMLVRTGDGAATRAALLSRGCVVRDCASFGMPEWVRVAPQRPEENLRLLAAWKEIV